MKTLNQKIDDYTTLIHKGEIQVAYKGIMDFMGQLRGAFAVSDLGVEVGGSIYQGYLDMTYFSLNTVQLKEKGLKIAIVYLHDKKAFEAWLSARNRSLSSRYRLRIKDMPLDEVEVFHDEMNEDAVLECLLTATPDFDHQHELMAAIETGTGKFISTVHQLLSKISLP